MPLRVRPRIPNSKDSLTDDALTGTESREDGSPSYFNIDELSLVAEYVEELRTDSDLCQLVGTNDVLCTLLTRD